MGFSDLCCYCCVDGMGDEMKTKLIEEVWKKKPDYLAILIENNLVAIVEDIINLSVDMYGYSRLYSKANYELRKLQNENFKLKEKVKEQTEKLIRVMQTLESYEKC